MYYRLSRFSALHRFLRSISYTVLWSLPDPIKWAGMGMVLRFRLPYKLLRPGDVAIQIGAPWDLLKAGRSRGIHLARRVGISGKVIIIEPDEDNVAALREFVAKHDMQNVIIIPFGAWSHKARLRFLVDKSNPAANVIEEVVDTSRTDLARFDATEIDVDSVENFLREKSLPAPRLLSITTNGSENEILKGTGMLAKDIEFVATIGDEEQIPMLHDLHFEKYGGDDRGWTYRKKR